MINVINVACDYCQTNSLFVVIDYLKKYAAVIANIIFKQSFFYNFFIPNAICIFSGNILVVQQSSRCLVRDIVGNIFIFT